MACKRQLAEYSVFAEGNMTNFNATNMPVDFKFTVASSGSNATCQTRENFKNRTQKTGVGGVDVDSGSGKMSDFRLQPILMQVTWFILDSGLLREQVVVY